MNRKKFSDLQKMSPEELLNEIQALRKNKTSHLVTHDEHEQFLIELWAECFPNAKFDTHTNFFYLGGTSLQAVLLLSKIKNKFKIEFDLVELFKATTIASQAQLIKDALLEPKTTIAQYNYQQDIDLIENISLAGIDPMPKKINNLLLTGATGFLGLHLLKEFLVNTDKTIFCILRGASITEVTNRLVRRANENKIGISESEKKRIRCFCGDVSQKQLGLSDSDYEYITNNVDSIIHSAAVVNFVYPYELLRKTNVLSLLELMKIASTKTLKPIHFISTIGVFNNQFETLTEINENTDLSEVSHLNGYFQTKWVSEKICALAKEKGLPISIYRPSGITINSKSQVVSPDDLTYQLMKLSMKIGAFADLKSIIDVVPVNYVAEAISNLVHNYPLESNIYHITSGGVLSSKELIKQLPKSKFIKILPYNDYIEQATNLVNSTDDQRLQKLGPLLLSSIVMNATATGNIPVFNSKETDALLKLKSKPCIKDTLLLIMKAVRRDS